MDSSLTRLKLIKDDCKALPLLYAQTFNQVLSLISNQLVASPRRDSRRNTLWHLNAPPISQGLDNTVLWTSSAGYLSSNF